MQFADVACALKTQTAIFHDLHAKVAAVIPTPQRFRSMPNKPRMQTGVADVVAVAIAAAQRRSEVI